jgi:hypothetical protein
MIQIGFKKGLNFGAIMMFLRPKSALFTGIHCAAVRYKGYSGVKKEDIGPQNTCFPDGSLKYSICWRGPTPQPTATDPTAIC